jgi:RNA polymerase sigma-70 factor, ECF subfamily
LLREMPMHRDRVQLRIRVATCSRGRPLGAPLLVRVATGDEVAFRECLSRYARVVWSIVRRFAATDAEDAVQEIFLDLWRSAARFDPSIASEIGFVAMIARRRVIDHQRTQRRRLRIEQLERATCKFADASRLADSFLEAQHAARALQSLRLEQRQVLVLSMCHGLSHGEIAAHTGMPLGTVKAHARRGLLSLRAALRTGGDL